MSGIKRRHQDTRVTPNEHRAHGTSPTSFANEAIAKVRQVEIGIRLNDRQPVFGDAHARLDWHTGLMTQPFRLSFVCTGNICRSPMADVIFRAIAERAGASDRFEVMSSGTHGYHIGEGADPRTAAALAAAGYDGNRHQASQLSETEVRDFDLLIALDRGHEQILLRRGVTPDRIALLTEFDPEQPKDPDVFDPYYSDEQAFARVLAQIERSCAVLLTRLTEQIERPAQ